MRARTLQGGYKRSAQNFSGKIKKKFPEKPYLKIIPRRVQQHFVGQIRQRYRAECSDHAIAAVERNPEPFRGRIGHGPGDDLFADHPAVFAKTIRHEETFPDRNPPLPR